MTILSLLLLALIFVPGAYHKVGGAYRWIKLGIVRYQCSELAKLALIFFLAKNLSRPKYDFKNFKKGVLPNLLIIASYAFLILQQYQHPKSPPLSQKNQALRTALKTPPYNQYIALFY